MLGNRSLDKISQQQPNPWRKRIGCLLAASLALAVPRLLPSHSTPTAQRQSHANTTRRPRPQINIFNRRPAILNFNSIAIVPSILPTETIADQVPTLVDADEWGRDYGNRGAMAAVDLEARLGIDGSEAISYRDFRTSMIDILANDYGIMPPSDAHNSHDPYEWTMGTIQVQSRMDELAIELNQNGQAARALEIATAGGNIDLAVELSLQHDRPELAINAVANRLSETHSDHHWREFFRQALRSAPELFQILYERFSPQQEIAAIEALYDLIRLAQGNISLITTLLLTADAQNIPRLQIQRDQEQVLLDRYQAVLAWSMEEDQE